MFDFDYVMKKDIKKHNPNCEEIPDHPYRMLIAGSPGSGKSFHEPDIDNLFYMQKIHMKQNINC